MAMMYRLLLGFCFALSLAACATHPAAPVAAGNSMPAAVPAWQPPPATAQQTPAGCVPTTATRLPVAPGQCSSAFGSTFSQKDIQRTGQQNLATALQMLDPTVLGHGR